ncbi:phosphate ABC transporter substrate-binding protein [Pseudoalteromonas sp. T1lg65]|uniref:phosphate ABC transporter substrate-binding protein n=1 Tax=Pseudoalteromonas sp. T1lg65 TaxID=2077101 RepID=UPI003F79A6D3
MKKWLTIMAALVVSNSALAVDVIVHADNATTLGKNEIRQIYLGALKNFPGGGGVEAISQPEDSPATADFYAKVMERSASQLKAHWSKQLFTGKGKPPKEAPNDQAVIDMVSSNPNYIGFVASGSATGNVKVVGSF